MRQVRFGRERAIELRRSLPLEGNPWYRYVLAAGWMNRGDALTRLGSPENLVEAVRSYDEALVIPVRVAWLPEERVHFELFAAGHRGIDYRYPLALAWLCHRIADQPG